MNDKERENWIRNDEGLYCCWISSRKPMKVFIRENREALTRAIEAMLNNQKPQHFLRYGG